MGFSHFCLWWLQNVSLIKLTGTIMGKPTKLLVIRNMCGKLLGCKFIWPVFVLESTAKMTWDFTVFYLPHLKKWFHEHILRTSMSIKRIIFPKKSIYNAIWNRAHFALYKRIVVFKELKKVFFGSYFSWNQWPFKKNPQHTKKPVFCFWVRNTMVESAVTANVTPGEPEIYCIFILRAYSFHC